MNGRGNDFNRGYKKKPTAMAEFFPLSGGKAVHRRQRPMHLRAGVGVVELIVWYGQDPRDGHWGCPIREHWGLSVHQQLSLALEDKLAFTVTATGSYAEAAAVAEKWGSPVEDSTLHNLAQRLGRQAEQQTQRRLKQVPREVQPQRVATELAVLMLDGWLVRHRGPGWGKGKTQQERVAWHEFKIGVYYRHEQAARTASGRGVLAEKLVVGWQGEPAELGRRLHWEALGAGLGRAAKVLAVADGAPWIWSLVRDRWPGATEVLDFYHATEHLWNLGRALNANDEVAAARWVEPRRHQLRHGRHKQLMAEIASLKPSKDEAGTVVEREQNYFAAHTRRINYRAISQRGWPIGSGAVESACRQRQCRFKRSGQFWTSTGLRNLSALDEARRNQHWDELWQHA